MQEKFKTPFGAIMHISDQRRCPRSNGHKELRYWDKKEPKKKMFKKNECEYVNNGSGHLTAQLDDDNIPKPLGLQGNKNGYNLQCLLLIGVSVIWDTIMQHSWSVHSQHSLIHQIASADTPPETAANHTWHGLLGLLQWPPIITHLIFPKYPKETSHTLPIYFKLNLNVVAVVICAMQETMHNAWRFFKNSKMGPPHML